MMVVHPHPQSPSVVAGAYNPPMDYSYGLRHGVLDATQRSEGMTVWQWLSSGHGTTAILAVNHDCRAQLTNHRLKREPSLCSQYGVSLTIMIMNSIILWISIGLCLLYLIQSYLLYHTKRFPLTVGRDWLVQRKGISFGLKVLWMN